MCCYHVFCCFGRLARDRRASRKATPLSALYFTVFPCANEVGWPTPRAWYLVVLGAIRGWVRTWRVSLSASLLPGPLGQSHGESWACSHTWRFPEPLALNWSSVPERGTWLFESLCRGCGGSWSL